MRQFLLLLALAAAACWQGEARAAERDPGNGLRRCGVIYAYLDDTAPEGREVRAGPDEHSALLGRILPPLRVYDSPIEVGFRVLRSRDGWLEVEGAGDDPVLTEGVEREMYHGRGWIRGDGVDVSVQASQIFSAPRFSSDIVLSSRDGHFIVFSADMVATLACDGDWVRARWRLRDPEELIYLPDIAVSGDPLLVEGWATGICNTQETSCDGVNGDRPTCSLEQLDHCRTTNSLVWVPAFESAVRLFVGQSQFKLEDRRGPLWQQLMNKLGGPPDRPIALADENLLFTACEAHNCSEKGAIVLTPTGTIVATAMVTTRSVRESPDLGAVLRRQTRLDVFVKVPPAGEPAWLAAIQQWARAADADRRKTEEAYWDSLELQETVWLIEPGSPHLRNLGSSTLDCGGGGGHACRR